MPCTMAATIQHADALKLLKHLEGCIVGHPGHFITYSEAAQVLGRKPAKESRHVGQVTSRIDAACFYAKTPFLAMHCVRETHGGTVNPRSFQDDLWKPHAPALIALAERHVWTTDDFKRIRSALMSLGDDSAKLLWERIGLFGEKGVQKALAAGTHK